MSRKRTSSHIWTLWVAFGVSCVVHVLLFVELARLIDGPDPVDAEPPEPTSSPPENLEVTMTREPPEQVSEPPDEPPEDKQQKQEDEKEKKEEKKKELVRQYDRKAVVQETNEQQPDKADYVSPQANKVEKETRARNPEEQFVPESESSADQKKGKKQAAEETKLGSKAVAERKKPSPKPPTSESRQPPEPSKSETETTEEQPDADREPTDQKAPEAPEPSESKEAPKPNDRPDEPLPMPSADDLSRIFDSSKDREKVEEHAQKGAGHEMFEQIEDNKGAVESAMKNYVSEVEPGNHTAVNARADVAATYVNRIHSKIHPKWGGEFLPMLDTNYGPDSPLSNSSLNTVLEFVVDGETGELESVNLVESSGVTTYDMEAINIAKEVAPHPRAPSAIRSPNGNVYLHWNFWRDQRQCGTFGVSIYKLTEDGVKEKK